MRKLVGVIVVGILGCKHTPPEPFKGALTVDILMTAKDVAKPFDPWADGLAEIEGKVGVPTKVDGTKYYWAAMRGDDCAYFYVEQEDGKKFHKDGLMVGAVMAPTIYGKTGAIMNRAECLELVGKGVPEDPNATPPPTDGSAVQVDMFVKNAIPGRAKWGGKPVRVIGTLNQLGTDAYLYDLTDTDRKRGNVDCHLDTADNRSGLLGQTVIATGTVKLDEAVTGAGQPSFMVELEHCALTTP